MKHPVMVYKYPGKKKIGRDFFDYKVVEGEKVNDEELSQLEEHLASGWSSSPSEAKDGVVDDDEMPTREELEEKAKKLGLSFPSNIKDGTLLDKINEAIEAGEK